MLGTRRRGLGDERDGIVDRGSNGWDDAEYVVIRS